MPSRSYAPHHQLPGSIHRELPDPCLESLATQPTHPSSLIERRCIDSSFYDSISDPITYCVDDVIMHLRGACGLDKGNTQSEGPTTNDLPSMDPELHRKGEWQ